MDDELDLVVFDDDAGNEITMKVIDYFFYEGLEYAMLTEYVEDCDTCERDACEGCDNQGEVIVMKVVPVGEDDEEFVPVDDDMQDKLLELIESGLYDEAGEFDEDVLDDEPDDESTE